MKLTAANVWKNLDVYLLPTTNRINFRSKQANQSYRKSSKATNRRVIRISKAAQDKELGHEVISILIIIIIIIIITITTTSVIIITKEGNVESMEEHGAEDNVGVLMESGRGDLIKAEADGTELGGKTAVGREMHRPSFVVNCPPSSSSSPSSSPSSSSSSSSSLLKLYYYITILCIVNT